MVSCCATETEPSQSQEDATDAEAAASTAEGRVCLVLGSEGQGLSGETEALCRPVSIPMSGGMESLNVSQAGAMLLYTLSPGLAAVQAQLKAYGVLVPR